jgi:Flp pilus assembly protein TadB
MNQLTKFPLVQWAMHHPRLAAWIVLALGMVILLVIEARDVGLLATQWVALVVATILVAGACVWIISWEDKDEASEADSTTDKSAQPEK